MNRERLPLETNWFELTQKVGDIGSAFLHVLIWIWTIEWRKHVMCG